MVLLTSTLKLNFWFFKNFKKPKFENLVPRIDFLPPPRKKSRNPSTKLNGGTKFCNLGHFLISVWGDFLTFIIFDIFMVSLEMVQNIYLDAIYQTHFSTNGIEITKTKIFTKFSITISLYIKNWILRNFVVCNSFMGNILSKMDAYFILKFNGKNIVLLPKVEKFPKFCIQFILIYEY